MPVLVDKVERKAGGKTVVWDNQSDCLGLKIEPAPVCVNVCTVCVYLCVITSEARRDSFCEVDWLAVCLVKKAFGSEEL